MFNKGGGNIKTDPNPVNTGTLRSRLEQIEAKNAAGRKETADLGAKVITLTAKIKGSVDPEEITTAADNATTDPNTAPDTAPTTNPDTTPDTSPDRQPTVTETANTAKHKPVFKRMLATIVIVALTGGAAGGAAGAFGRFLFDRYFNKNSSPNEHSPDSNPSSSTISFEALPTAPNWATSPIPPEVPINSETGGVDLEASGEDIPEFTGIESLDRQIFENSYSKGYDNTGCFNSPNKVHTEDMGNIDEILREMGVDPSTATAEERGAARAFMSYSMPESAAPVAMATCIDDFGTLSYDEAVAKIKNFSPNEELAFRIKLSNVHKNTAYEYDTAQGLHKNQYGYKDADGNIRTEYNEKDLTGERVLVAKYTLEKEETIKLPNGSEATLPLDTVVEYVSREVCGNDEDIIIYHVPNAEPINYRIVIPPAPERTPESPEKESTSKETQDETKNSAAIVANMQTDPSVTSNTVTPSGSGAPAERPIVVEGGSYNTEQNYNTTPKPTQVQQEPDKTFAGHQTLTPEQTTAAKAQLSATDAAKDIAANADLYSGMQDPEAAAWFEGLSKQGG